MRIYKFKDYVLLRFSCLRLTWKIGKSTGNHYHVKWKLRILIWCATRLKLLKISIAIRRWSNFPRNCLRALTKRRNLFFCNLFSLFHSLYLHLTYPIVQLISKLCAFLCSSLQAQHSIHSRFTSDVCGESRTCFRKIMFKQLSRKKKHKPANFLQLFIARNVGVVEKFLI